MIQMDNKQSQASRAGTRAPDHPGVTNARRQDIRVFSGHGPKRRERQIGPERADRQNRCDGGKREAALCFFQLFPERSGASGAKNQYGGEWRG